MRLITPQQLELLAGVSLLEGRPAKSQPSHLRRYKSCGVGYSSLPYDFLEHLLNRSFMSNFLLDYE